ncbi:hypothetical protein J2X76_003960 [Neorhizobium sp. 2083]|uniref:hypothetical protein n=1 Tax=Neorhizobium sp. 2083 TaxID=2817762 RepID=UPI002858665D|nr:hypothetical protein [Neorhizobium sp. 2083]MDR6818778.1 hypothetical protein [Neorhizobium sp. 2083]
MIAPVAEGAFKELIKAGDTVAVQSVVNVVTAAGQAAEDLRKSVNDSLESTNKAIADTADNLSKTANDIVDAAHAAYNFAERETKGAGDILSAAEKRVREGKVVDAMWHIGTDRLKATNDNAAQAVRENEILSQAAQAAATAYGGPAGAAAYAAWKAYNDSDGNVELALAAGTQAYVMSIGGANASALPQDTAGEILKKAAVTGAMGGVAVAASGGSTQDSLNEFVRSGGAVIVQAGQTYVDKNYVDPAKTRLDTFCTTQTGMTCADAKQWAEKSAKRIDELKNLKEVRPTIALTKGGDWAISWDTERVKALQPNEPAVVLTYVGPGSPYRQTLNQIAALSNPRFASPPGVKPQDSKPQGGNSQPGNTQHSNPQANIPQTVNPNVTHTPGGSSEIANTWVAFRDVGDKTSFFNDPATGRYQAAPVVGDVLIANRDINARARPADWTGVRSILKSGQRVAILEIKLLPAGQYKQEWVRIGIR